MKAQFTKGHQKMGGRKKGTPNKKKVLKVADVLAEKGINPVEKILEQLPYLDPKDQVKAWLELQSYTEAKPREVEVDPPEADDEDAVKKATTAELLSIVRKSKEDA